MRSWFRAMAIGSWAGDGVCVRREGAEPFELDRILKEKKIRVTAEVTSPPFGMIDANGQPDGSEIATARQLAKDLGRGGRLCPGDGPQRIPALLSGRADIAISSLSMTIDRAKMVMFANPHGALSIVIAAPAGVEDRGCKRDGRQADRDHPSDARRSDGAEDRAARTPASSLRRYRGNHTGAALGPG